MSVLGWQVNVSLKAIQIIHCREQKNKHLSRSKALETNVVHIWIVLRENYSVKLIFFSLQTIKIQFLTWLYNGLKEWRTSVDVKVHMFSTYSYSFIDLPKASKTPGELLSNHYLYDCYHGKNSYFISLVNTLFGALSKNLPFNTISTCTKIRLMSA